MSERDLNTAIAELAASVPNGELLSVTDAPEFLRAVCRQLAAERHRRERAEGERDEARAACTRMRERIEFARKAAKETGT